MSDLRWLIVWSERDALNWREAMQTGVFLRPEGPSLVEVRDGHQDGRVAKPVSCGVRDESSRRAPCSLSAATWLPF